MRYRQLGSSELKVSEIALGSWLTYGVGVERQNAEACVHAALACGINFIDTANGYGKGAAEDFLGGVLAAVERSSYVLATKLFFPMSPTDKGLSRTQVVKQLDASLKRLRTPYIDLYQCHRYDPETPLEETMRALTDAVSQGKVRYIGFSEWPADKIQAAISMTGVTQFVSSQPQYSMLWRAPEQAVIPLCKANGISQIVWSPLGQGVLTGKYLPDQPTPPDSRANSSQMGHYFPKEWLARPVLQAIQDIKPLAASVGLSLSQFSLAWVLRDSAVAAAIIGASRPAQVTENAVAAGADVPAALFLQAEDLLTRALAAGAKA